MREIKSRKPKTKKRHYFKWIITELNGGTYISSNHYHIHSPMVQKWLWQLEDGKIQGLRAIQATKKSAISNETMWELIPQDIQNLV